MMMSQPNPRHGTILPQNTGFDAGDDSPGTAQPISQSEIEELLYNDERPVDERIERLRALRDEAAIRASGDTDRDARVLLRELDNALDTLVRDEEAADDNSEFAAFDAAYEIDPADHLEALSPDDEDGRMAIEGDGLDSLEEPPAQNGNGRRT
jgi:hypothetical protein